MSDRRLSTPTRRQRKPRYTVGGRPTANKSGIWTAQIDETGANWYGFVMVHRSTKDEAIKVRDLILKALNK